MPPVQPLTFFLNQDCVVHLTELECLTVARSYNTPMFTLGNPDSYNLTDKPVGCSSLQFLGAPRTAFFYNADLSGTPSTTCSNDSNHICFCGQLDSPPSLPPPPASPPPLPPPIQPLLVQSTGFCALGSVTEDECRVIADNEGVVMQSGSSSTIPSGCTRVLNTDGTFSSIAYNLNMASTVPCEGTFLDRANCICRSTELHALVDLVWKTTLTIPQQRITRLYHKKLSAGGLVDTGDEIRYVPTSTFTTGSTACPGWDAASGQNPLQAGGGQGAILFPMVTSSSNPASADDLFLDVNLNDLNSNDVDVEYEYCYLRNSGSSGRRLSESNQPLRGGGLLIVQLANTPSPPPCVLFATQIQQHFLPL